MCHYSYDVLELARISEDLDENLSYLDDYSCLEKIKNEKMTTEFSVSSRKEVDNKRWFTDEVAKALSVNTALFLSQKYPEKIIVQKAGLQVCSGGWESPDAIKVFYQGNEIINYPDENDNSPILGEEILEVIRKRQIQIKEEEKNLKPFKFTTIRYTPDIIAGEFINVGFCMTFGENERWITYLEFQGSIERRFPHLTDLIPLEHIKMFGDSYFTNSNLSIKELSEKPFYGMLNFGENLSGIHENPAEFFTKLSQDYLKEIV